MFDTKTSRDLISQGFFIYTVFIFYKYRVKNLVRKERKEIKIKT